jgi:ribosomal protein S17
MIVESKPISHKVRWVVQEILKKSEIQEIGVEEG